MKTLLIEREVADAFRVSGRTIRRWAASGILPSIVIGGIRRYPAEDIDAIIAPSPHAPGRDEG